MTESTTSPIMWRTTPDLAEIWALKAADLAGEVRSCLFELPTDGFVSVHKEAESNQLLLRTTRDTNSSCQRVWIEPLEKLADSLHVISGADCPDGSWICLYARPNVARAFLEKRAESPTLSFLAKATGNKPGFIPGAPKPLAALLAGGLLGSGLGYGAGWAAEKVLPGNWEPGKLRRAWALAGGALGASPAVLRMMNNYSRGDSVLFGNDMDPGETDLSGTTQRLQDQVFPPGKTASMTGYDGVWPVINVPAFTAQVWHDPNIQRQIDLPTRAAATGLLRGASQMNGGSPWVTPMDVGRMTAAMGSGYVSGAIIGKTLGALAGMPEETQDKLKNVGLWAGIVKTVVPLAFGG